MNTNLEPGGGEYNPNAPILPVQIISLALMQGVLVFGAIAVFMTWRREQPAGDSVLPAIAAVLAVIAVVARFVLPPIIARNAARRAFRGVSRHDRRQVQTALYGIFQTRTIIEDALLEGASFFVLVALMATGQWWLLGVVFALLAIMAATFPTKGRIEDFIHEHQQQQNFEEDQ